MAAFEYSRAAERQFGSSIARAFAQVAAAVMAWNDARVTRNALAALSDRELEDIGLSRGDIDAIADGIIIR